MKYRHFHRGGSWSSEFRCQWSQAADPDEPAAHNYWHPRIDVGRIDGIFPDDDVMGVGIAYSSQYHKHNGFHVHVFYWDADAEGDSTKYPDLDPQTGNTVRCVCLRNPVGTSGQGDYDDPEPSTWWNAAGMPNIDIGFSTSSENHGSIVFVQIVGSDLYGQITEIWEINSLRLNFQRVTTDAPIWADGLYPSIALHRGMVGGDFPHRASVTYFRLDDDFTNVWNPWVVEFGLDQHGPYDQGEPPVPINPAPVIQQFPVQLPVIPIRGIYNPSQVNFIYPGAASAICVTTGSWYWAAWSERLWLDVWSDDVYAAWGNTR